MKGNHLIALAALLVAGYFFYESRLSDRADEAAGSLVAATGAEAEEAEAEAPAEPTGAQEPSGEARGQEPAAPPPAVAAGGGSGYSYRYVAGPADLRTEGLKALEERPAWAAFLLASFLRYAPDDPRAAEVRQLLDGLAAKERNRGVKLEQGRDLVGARSAYTVALFASRDPERAADLRHKLDALAAICVFGPQPTEEAPWYTVEPGDYLQRIGRSHGVPAAWIQRLNNLSGSMIRVGQRLKVPRGPVEVWVSKRDFRLYVTLGDRYLRSYKVGTGRNDCSPEAAFTVGTKQVKPTWYQTQPDGRVIAYPFGHEKNVLGTRWLGFQHDGQKTSFGIHGTSLPDTVGTESSDGCLRMRNADVEELYDIVPRGGKVVILR